MLLCLWIKLWIQRDSAQFGFLEQSSFLEHFSKCRLNQHESWLLISNLLMLLSFLLYELQATLFNKCPSCFLLATSNKQPPGRTLARPFFRWTRQLLLILCQSSSRTLWTQPVVSVYLLNKNFFFFFLLRVEAVWSSSYTPLRLCVSQLPPYSWNLP